MSLPDWAAQHLQILLDTLAMQTGGFGVRQTLSSYRMKFHNHCTYTSPSRCHGPGPPGHKGLYSKSMTCQSRWRTKLETSQWMGLFQKWKSCYLRNVTGFIVLQAAIETESLTSPVPSLRHWLVRRRPAAGFLPTGNLYLVWKCHWCCCVHTWSILYHSCIWMLSSAMKSWDDSIY